MLRRRRRRHINPLPGDESRAQLDASGDEFDGHFASLLVQRQLHYRLRGPILPT